MVVLHLLVVIAGVWSDKGRERGSGGACFSGDDMFGPSRAHLASIALAYMLSNNISRRSYFELHSPCGKLLHSLIFAERSSYCSSGAIG
jgi:hypothetical protein